MSSMSNTASMNNTANNNKILQMIKDLQQQIHSLTLQKSYRTLQTVKVTTQGNRKRFNSSKYCWKNGACAHSSKDCKTKNLTQK